LSWYFKHEDVELLESLMELKNENVSRLMMMSLRLSLGPGNELVKKNLADEIVSLGEERDAHIKAMTVQITEDYDRKIKKLEEHYQELCDPKMKIQTILPLRTTPDGEPLSPLQQQSLWPQRPTPSATKTRDEIYEIFIKHRVKVGCADIGHIRWLGLFQLKGSEEELLRLLMSRAYDEKIVIKGSLLYEEIAKTKPDYQEKCAEKEQVFMEKLGAKKIEEDTIIQKALKQKKNEEEKQKQKKLKGVEGGEDDAST
jgi:hypothetical protein